MAKILLATEYLQTLHEFARDAHDLDFESVRTPSEALEKFATAGDYRLVIADLMLEDSGKYAADPAVDLTRVGFSLARDIRAITPSVPIILRTEAWNINASPAMKRPLVALSAGLPDLFVIWAPGFDAADIVSICPGIVEDDSHYREYGWWMDHNFPAREKRSVADMYGRFFGRLLIPPGEGPICNRLRRFSEGDIELDR